MKCREINEKLPETFDRGEDLYSLTYSGFDYVMLDQSTLMGHVLLGGTVRLGLHRGQTPRAVFRFISRHFIHREVTT